MKKESLIAIKHYISILKSYFPFVNFEERRFICDLRREMIEYAKDNPFVTYEKLLEEYGSPEDIAEEYIYINETFALTLLLQASGCYDENTQFFTEDEEEIKDLIGKMIYHLKYRNTNPQTLELFLIGLQTGKEVHNVR